MTATERWRGMWPSKEAAHRYLSQIGDAGKRQATAERLGLELLPPPTFAAPLCPVQPAAIQFQVTAQSVPGQLNLTLPYPPSLNHIWRHVIIKTPKGPQVRVLLSKVGRAYRRTVLKCVEDAGKPQTPPTARLSLTLLVSPPDRRARDLSNLPKALEDALTHAGVWADDSLIDELIIQRCPVMKGGQVLAIITPTNNTLFSGEL